MILKKFGAQVESLGFELEILKNTSME